LNVGNGGPVRIDGSAAEAGGTKLYASFPQTCAGRKIIMSGGGLEE
jgi:hypothetical protein